MVKLILIGIFIFLILDIWLFDGTRSFYCLSDNKCITVWKRSDKTCYIIPGKYYGIFKPSDNYIKTFNDNAFTIIVDDSSNFDYVIYNNYGKDVIINTSAYKIKYYEYNQRASFVRDFYINGRINKKYKYLKIDIKENLVVLNGRKE